jgi:hypothetical protein
MSFPQRVAAESAGAKRRRKLEICLEAAVHLDGGVAGANDALAYAPSGNSGNAGPGESVEGSYHTVVDSHETESAAIRIEIGGQIMQSSECPEVLRGDAPVFNASSRQYPVGDRLGCNSCQNRPPVVQGELGQRNNGDRK